MKADNLKISGGPQDDRIKFTPEQETEIRSYHSKHAGTTYRELGELFECSSSQAYYICNPRAEEKKNKRNKENAYLYRDKEVKRVATAKTRDKKRRILDAAKTQQK